MSDVSFEVVKRWAVDEWYGEYLVVRKGNDVFLYLHSDEIERLIKTWQEKRIEKKALRGVQK